MNSKEIRELIAQRAKKVIENSKHKEEADRHEAMAKFHREQAAQDDWQTDVRLMKQYRRVFADEKIKRMGAARIQLKVEKNIKSAEKFGWKKVNTSDDGNTLFTHPEKPGYRLIVYPDKFSLQYHQRFDHQDKDNSLLTDILASIK